MCEKCDIVGQREFLIAQRRALRGIIKALEQQRRYYFQLVGFIDRQLEEATDGQ